MNIFKIIPPVILLFLATVPVFAGEQPSVSDSFYAFSSHIAPDDIHISPSDIHYSGNSGKKNDFGIITYNKWCYIVIKASSPQQEKYILSVDNTSIDTVLLFRLTGNGSKQQVYIGGNLTPYNPARKYVWHTMPLRLDEGEAYYLAAFQDQGRNINAGYKIMTADNLDKRYTTFDRLIWFYLGTVFLILIGVLYGWFFLRSIALGYYSLYILSVTVWILSHYGYLYPMLYPGLPRLNGIIKPLAILCGLLFLSGLLHSLFRDILKKDKFSKAILNWIIRAGIVVLATIVSYPFLIKLKHIPALFNVGWYGYFDISFLCILLVLVRLFNKSVTARRFTLALGFIVLMAIQQVLSNSGFLHNEMLNDHGMLLASIAEMLVLTWATFFNIGEERKRTSGHIAQLEEAHFRTLEQLVKVQDSERKRIAVELHDSIGPMLAAIKINFLRVAKAGARNDDSDTLVAKTEEIIDGSMMEIREMSHQLMPKGLSSEGLVVSLSKYFENLQEVYNIPVQFNHNITASLHQDVQLNVYRIICELVLNAVKHSKSSCISITIETSGGTVTTSVNDDGRGFDPEQINDSSLGFKSIRSRVDYLKGTMQITSAAGKGTGVTITVPYGK